MLLLLLTALEQSQESYVNPVKRLWEAKGVRFPGRGILPNSSSTPTSSGCTATLGAEPVFYSDFAIPLTFEQEKMYFELGFNESLRSSSSKAKHIEKSAITDTYSSEPDVSEPADYCLSLLFIAGKLQGDCFGVMFVQCFYQLLQKNSTKLNMESHWEFQSDRFDF